MKQNGFNGSVEPRRSIKIRNALQKVAALSIRLPQHISSKDGKLKQKNKQSYVQLCKVLTQISCVWLMDHSRISLEAAVFLGTFVLFQNIFHENHRLSNESVHIV